MHSSRNNILPVLVRPALLTLSLALGTTGALADPITNPTNCKVEGTSTFSLNTIFKSAIDTTGNFVDAGGSPVWTAAGPAQIGDITTGGYTSCIGFFTGNDNVQFVDQPKPANNIGEFEDGLLNYGIFDDLLSGGDADKLDLSGDGEFIDPGWIRLVKLDRNGDEDFSDLINGDSLEDFVKFTMTDPADGKGDWSLRLNPEVVAIGQALGKDAFDHLAFVLKQGNKADKRNGFAVYDFDFKALLEGNFGVERDVAYNFYGSYDFTGITGNNFSHVTAWARDPALFSEVPSPMPLALIGVGLLGLLAIRSRKRGGA